MNNTAIIHTARCDNKTPRQTAARQFFRPFFSGTGLYWHFLRHGADLNQIWGWQAIIAAPQDRFHTHIAPFRNAGESKRTRVEKWGLNFVLFWLREKWGRNGQNVWVSLCDRKFIKVHTCENVLKLSEIGQSYCRNKTRHFLRRCLSTSFLPSLGSPFSRKHRYGSSRSD